jgi:hypothetical protein
MADYLEGDLALERRALFDAHLDECPECSDEIDAMRSTIALLRQLPEPEAPPQLVDDVMRRIRAGDARAGWLDGLRDIGASLLDPRVLAPVSAAMLALGIVLGTGQLPIGGLETEAVQTVATYPPSALLSETPGRSQPGATGPGVADAAAGSQRTDGRLAAQQSGNDGLLGISVRIQRWRGTPGPMGGGAPSMTTPGTLYVDAGRPSGTPQRAELGSRAPSSYVALRADTPTRALSEVRTADRWLDDAVRDPVAFAAGLTQAGDTSLAEHELWVKNLARRAVETDRLDEVVASLQSSSSPSARSLARDFEAEGQKLAASRSGGSSSGAN